jgi:hypothetical protein
LPDVLVNPYVFSVEGYLIGIPDLLSAESATVVEYDGADHLDAGQSALDARRDARFRVHGLNTVRVTRDDINGSREALIGRLQRAYIDGLNRDTADDRWTLDVPPGWVDPAGESPALDPSRPEACG